MDEMDLNIYINNKEVPEYTGGEGIFSECLNRFVNIILAETKNERKNIKVFCEKLTANEDKYFNDIFFPEICKLKSSLQSEIIIDCEKMKKKTKMNLEEIMDILYVLAKKKIEIRMTNGNDLSTMYLGNIFKEYQIIPYFRSNSLCCVINISQYLIKACIEVKNDKQKKANKMIKKANKFICVSKGEFSMVNFKDFLAKNNEKNHRNCFPKYSC
jgi:hypothetical protein